jgi:hypothetical protein
MLMFIQGLIRDGYYSALENQSPTIIGLKTSPDESALMHHGEHIGHCFDYIRQAIMCNADMTLEWAEVSPSGKVIASVDGWGIPHTCRSWDDAVEWTLKHKAPSTNHTGII